mmetsp:Transcript_36265/g.83352  ORF Transcript_36265/g.83352 Transcript_36265/m.83352 type:complete len:145 (-) Transcript_36265:2235-2669(-)
MSARAIAAEMLISQAIQEMEGWERPVMRFCPASGSHADAVKEVLQHRELDLHTVQLRPVDQQHMGAEVVEFAVDVVGFVVVKAHAVVFLVLHAEMGTVAVSAVSAWRQRVLWRERCDRWVVSASLSALQGCCADLTLCYSPQGL